MRKWTISIISVIIVLISAVILYSNRRVGGELYIGDLKEDYQVFISHYGERVEVTDESIKETFVNILKTAEVVQEVDPIFIPLGGFMEYEVDIVTEKITYHITPWYDDFVKMQSGSEYPQIHFSSSGEFAVKGKYGYGYTSKIAKADYIGLFELFEKVINN